ncbi:MAG: glycosyltransferase family 2 protein [Bacteroidetes bacterium]|nr:glycosyltransferase family 2 protein [Bacteroidota bacterium]
MTPYLQQHTIFGPQIRNKPSPNLGIIVVIPSYLEDYLLLSLMSLKRCALPSCDVEVIVVINNSEKEPEAAKMKNYQIGQQAEQFALKNRNPRLKFHVLFHTELPNKHAGVGLARKIGMDEAVWRFEKIGNSRGIITCFDSDSRCDLNYFQAIENHFKKHPKTKAGSIYFEHPLIGADFETEIYEGIILYELHLRYYINAQKFAGFPFAIQTIGSSMAVRSDAYRQQGGMNKRKAGEDFYFLHKFTPLGNFSEIKSTRVIPSPRISQRVPFGTGKAMQEIVKTGGNYLTYAPESFVDLKHFLGRVETLYTLSLEETEDWLESLPLSIQKFLRENHFIKRLQEIKKNTVHSKSFRNRFYRWFNAFMLMKYVHFARDNYYPNVDVHQAAKWLAGIISSFPPDELKTYSPKDILLYFRQLDRGI